MSDSFDLCLSQDLSQRLLRMNDMFVGWVLREQITPQESFTLGMVMLVAAVEASCSPTEWKQKVIDGIPSLIRETMADGPLLKTFKTIN